ncbi:MAG TPA: quinoprotein dehydrogenase-associated SoxYZ-like carrier [Methylomirabilota bacterium]|jgi:sulfur-oxidizing protein SoxY
MKRVLVLTGVLMVALVLGLGVPAVWAGELDTEQWAETRKTLFQNRPIREAADDVVQLEVALRPDDAAAVPVLIRVKPAKSSSPVKNLYVVIDRNPEPLAGVFHLTADSGLAEVQTRLRVETHSPMRAIAELQDGTLHMSTKLVKAAGGCAAPPVMVTAPPNLGQIQVRAQDKPVLNEPAWAQLIVVHPNHTGFQRHPLTTLPISAHYVTDVAVSFDGKPVMSVQTTIAMSEDPDFRFYFVPHRAGRLKVDVKDSRGQTWTKSMEVVAQ